MAENKFNIDVSELLPQLTEDVVKELKAAAIRNLSYEVQSAIQTAVREFIKTEVVPAAAAELAEQHASIRAAFVGGVLEACKHLVERMSADTKARLAGYEGTELVRKVIRDVIAP